VAYAPSQSRRVEARVRGACGRPPREPAAREDSWNRVIASSGAVGAAVLAPTLRTRLHTCPARVACRDIGPYARGAGRGTPFQFQERCSGHNRLRARVHDTAQGVPDAPSQACSCSPGCSWLKSALQSVQRWLQVPAWRCLTWTGPLAMASAPAGPGSRSRDHAEAPFDGLLAGGTLVAHPGCFTPDGSRLALCCGDVVRLYRCVAHTQSLMTCWPDNAALCQTSVCTLSLSTQRLLGPACICL
jgi:hypothetical protein